MGNAREKGFGIYESATADPFPRRVEWRCERGYSNGGKFGVIGFATGASTGSIGSRLAEPLERERSPTGLAKLSLYLGWTMGVRAYFVISGTARQGDARRSGRKRERVNHPAERTTIQAASVGRLAVDQRFLVVSAGAANKFAG